MGGDLGMEGNNRTNKIKTCFLPSFSPEMCRCWRGRCETRPRADHTTPWDTGARVRSRPSCLRIYFVIIFYVIILFHLVRFLPRPLEPASWRALPPGDCPAGGEEGAPPWLPGAVNMRMCWVDIMHQESWLCTKLDTHLKWRLRVELRGGVSSWGPQAFTTGL